MILINSGMPAKKINTYLTSAMGPSNTVAKFKSGTIITNKTRYFLLRNRHITPEKNKTKYQPGLNNKNPKGTSCAVFDLAIHR